MISWCAENPCTKPFLFFHLALSPGDVSAIFTPFDLKRLQSYSNNMLDYHVVLDLLPSIASLYFTRRLGPDVSLASAQQAILLALGLQRKSIEEVETELDVPVSQGLALFVKIMRKISRKLQDLQKTAAGAEIPTEAPEILRKVDANGEANVVGTSDWRPMPTTVEQDLEEVVDEETKKAKAMQRELIDQIDLAKYAIDDSTDWSEAQERVQQLATVDPDQRKRMSTVVTVKGAAPVKAAEAPAPASKRKSDSSRSENRKSKKPKSKSS